MTNVKWTLSKRKWHRVIISPVNEVQVVYRNLFVFLPVCLSVQIRVRPITVFSLTLASNIWHMGVLL